MKVKIKDLVGVIVKNGQPILGINEALTKLFSFEMVDLKLAYWLGIRLKDSAETEIKRVSKSRDKLVESLGRPHLVKTKVPDPEDNTKMIEKEIDSGLKEIPEENLEKFNEEWENLMDEEIEIKFEPVNLSRLQKQNIKLSGSDMKYLAPFIIDDMEGESLI